MADYQWPGNDPADYVKLEAAVHNSCDGSCSGKCGAHRMLDDSKLLERLAYVKARVEDYRIHEFAVPKSQ